MNNSLRELILHIRKAVLQIHIKKFHSATGDKVSFIHFGLKVIITRTLCLINTVKVNQVEKTINP